MGTTGNEKLIFNYEEKDENNLAFSIDRYLKYILQLNRLKDKKSKTIQILLVEIDKHWDPDAFIKNLRGKQYKNINGLLFLTMEEFPRGDWPESNLNKSRMIREMFENSYNAVTANYSNIIPGTYQLVSRMIKSNTGQKGLSEVLEKFGALQKMLVFELTLNQRQNVLRELTQNGEMDDYKKDELLNFLSRNYLLGGIHSSKIGHAGLRELYDSLDKEGEVNLERLWKKVNLLETLYDLAFISASNPLRFSGLEILIIDDNPEKIEEDFKKRKIVDYFSPGTEIYITGENEWKKFLHGNPFWKEMYTGAAKLKMYRIGNRENPTANNNPDNKGTPLFEEQKFKFHYVLVDLLMEDYNEGNEIINCLVDFRKNYNRQGKDKGSYWDIIAFSLSEEAHDISRALNEGSLYYIHKSRPLMLPAVIAQLEKGRQILEDREKDIRKPHKSRVFGKLYRLPELLKRHLKSEPFLDLAGKEDFQKKWNNNSDAKYIQDLNEFIKVPAKEWIRNMPKADLHFHLGGSIPLEAIFFLSLNMLKDIPYPVLTESFSRTRELILKKLGGDWNNISNLFKIDTTVMDKTVLDEIIELLDSSIPSFQAVNIFNVLIGILEGKEKDDIKEFWDQLKTLNNIEFKPKSPAHRIIRKCLLGLSGEDLDTISEKSINLFNDILDIRESMPPLLEKSEDFKGLLNHFVSAKLRKTESLDEYLAGNKLIGSEQMQKKENILAALYLIIKKNIEDNIRYLEIRLSPDGYTNSGELTIQEAINALLEYTDLITCYFYQKGKFIRVNYIFSVKRHKPPNQAAIEVSAAITNRERENKFNGIIPSVTRNNTELLKYQWKPSKVVGVDLAGIEKDNPARRFVNDFFPLFKTSFFITVHAGEEETDQSIWEAIYLLHANRIGHGLTLKDNQYLIALFRDLQICIEMNPISNLMTHNSEKKEEEYPFYEFVIEGIKVTINTDNQSVSESTLSEEYIKAAELYQWHRKNTRRNWISKWDILRVIKNGFSSAFMNREEKRNFMRAVEEEIYQKIIKEYGC